MIITTMDFTKIPEKLAELRELYDSKAWQHESRINEIWLELEVLLHEYKKDLFIALQKDAVETWIGEKYQLSLFIDTDATNPRFDRDDVINMVSWDRRYTNLTEKRLYGKDSIWDSFDDLKDYLEANCIYLWFTLHDHSGQWLTINTKEPNAKDGATGVAYIGIREANINFYHLGNLAEERFNSYVLDYIRLSIKELDMYIRGQVYSYRLYENFVEIDSCSGIYLDKYSDIFDYLSDEVSKELNGTT